MADEAHRRQFLRLTGTATVLALAGCSAGGSSDEGSGTTRSDGTGTSAGHGEESNGTGESTETSGGTKSEHGGGGGHGENGGHGESRHHGHDSAIAGPSKSATVKLVSKNGGFHFEPHVVWVDVGGTVTWELVDGSHTATAYAEANDRPRRIPGGAAAFDSGTLSEKGATFGHTFETEGVYDYFCVPHEAMGMVGSVVVGTPSPEGQPGLRPAQQRLPGEAPAKVEKLNEMVTEALANAENHGSDASSDSETDRHGSESGHGHGSDHAHGSKSGTDAETDHHG